MGKLALGCRHETHVFLLDRSGQKEVYAKFDFLYDVDFKNTSAYKFLKRGENVTSHSDEYHRIVNYEDIIDNSGNIIRNITIY